MLSSNKKQTKNFKVDFIISGVMKGGTTAARFTMSQHPELYLAPTETGFFTDASFYKGLDWYKEQFQIPNDFTGMVGEKTPRYCVCAGVFPRIKKLFPDAKILMFLRDPVKRFYSHWNHIRVEFEERGDEFMPFCEYLVESESKLSRINHPLNPFSRGVYVKQLKSIVDVIGLENLYISISEKCRNNPLKEYNKIFNFLNVSELSEHQLKPRDHHTRPYLKPMLESEIGYLQEFYKPHNEQLFEFLGYEIKEWENNQ